MTCAQCKYWEAVSTKEGWGHCINRQVQTSFVHGDAVLQTHEGASCILGEPRRSAACRMPRDPQTSIRVEDLDTLAGADA
jgi:hypothetical protein